MIYLIIFLIAAVLFFGVLWTLYYIAFSPMRKTSANYRDLPDTPHYNKIKEQIMKQIDELESLEYQDISIKSHDGLTLYGMFYERENTDVIEIEFHGYRSNGLRDYCGGAKMCGEKGISSIIIEQRAHGRSEGNAITFGIKERYDVLSWVNYVINRFGKDVKIILSGVSMGAATVLMASELNLPHNVAAIIADCPFSSPKEIICRVARKKGLYEKAVYPIIRLSAKIFAHIDIEESSAQEAVKHTNVPIIIFHGEDDKFVPCEMSRKIFESCSSEKKKLITVKGAGHATSYFTDNKLYVSTLSEFLENALN